MRIIAGSAGGRRLEVPRGARTRPTSDRVREALFSSLEARRIVAGARVLDLYAGSGALGLEAASRGADSVVLVDSAREAVGAIRRNLRSLDLDRVDVVHSTVERFLHGNGAGAPFDLVFCDPPYKVSGEELAEVLAALVRAGSLVAGGLLVIERAAGDPEPGWPSGMVPEQARRYGGTVLWSASVSDDE
jgi:16S rRNA (guanine966-N2)-methyltransferase